jgi:hypothetical protein
MNNAEYHKPWEQSSPEPPRRTLIDLGTRLPGMIRGAMAFIASHFRRIANWWSSRLRLLWRGPGAGARLAAIGLFLSGLAALVILGYLLLYLIPLLILAAFIAAICSTLAVKE